ncbi:hypothetical protein EVG20_g10404, partial [Dentipellis fragilis]
HETESTPPAVCLSLRIDLEAVHFECWRTHPEQLFALPPKDQPFLNPNPPHDVSLWFKDLDTTVRRQQLLRDVLDGLGLDVDSVTALRVLFEVNTDIDWRGLFGCFNAVEQLVVGGAAVQPLVDELCANPFESYPSSSLEVTFEKPAIPDPADSQWLFPNLHRLKVGHTNFLSYPDKNKEYLCTVFIKMLEDARGCAVMDIRELLVEDCGVDESTIEEFRRVVPKVSWDGRFMFSAIMPGDDDLENVWAL